jgi:hypothetical protein
MKLKKSILSSLFVWLLTGVIGSCVISVTEFLGLELYETLALSLIFSIPALILLIPNFYFLESALGKAYKMTYAFFSILFISGIVVMVLLAIIGGVPFEGKTFMEIILPYVFAAEFSFFAVMHKEIFSAQK